MGQIMGSYGARKVDLYMGDKTTYDPQAGFSYERKERDYLLACTKTVFHLFHHFPEMIAKEEDLISARIPPHLRDYCAHHLLEYQVCRYKQMPLLYKCAHEKHNYLNCEQQDYVLRMKEFERERRLRVRERRVAA